VPPNRISQIIHGKRAITGDTALRLGHWFQTSAAILVNLQIGLRSARGDRRDRPRGAALPTKAARRRAGG